MNIYERIINAPKQKPERSRFHRIWVMAKDTQGVAHIASIGEIYGDEYLKMYRTSGDRAPMKHRLIRECRVASDAEKKLMQQLLLEQLDHINSANQYYVLVKNDAPAGQRCGVCCYRDEKSNTCRYGPPSSNGWPTVDATNDDHWCWQFRAL